MRDRDAVLEPAILGAAAVLVGHSSADILSCLSGRQRGVTSQLFAELFWSQPRRTKNGAQGAAIQGPVVRWSGTTA